MRELATTGQDIDNATQCFTFQELSTGNQRNNQQDLRNCALLNRANPYFNLPPKKMNRTGKAKLMSSRNNNFSNRGQKFKLSVYQKAINVTTNNHSDFQTSNSNSNSNSDGDDNGNKMPVVGIVIGVLVVVGLTGVLIFKRKDISNYVSKTKKNIKLSTSTRI